MGEDAIDVGNIKVESSRWVPTPVYELAAEGLWDDQMRREIMAHSGSVQRIERIPPRIRALFKTVWEISQKTVIDLAADRGAFGAQLAATLAGDDAGAAPHVCRAADLRADDRRQVPDVWAAAARAVYSPS